jgi:hypothetical protein
MVWNEALGESFQSRESFVNTCGFSKLNPRDSLVVSNAWRSPAFMMMPTSATLPLVRTESRTRIALLLEGIALRHQIAVLERSGTRRPCFRPWDRLFWILFSRWWPQWRDSLIIVPPETVLRWRREGWSSLWRYRSPSRWRGGRPRVSSEVRHLIAQMARENFLWGAPRIHGELLMLGFNISQATVSRYLPAPGRRPKQSWRTFLRNQAGAFGQYSAERSKGCAHLHGPVGLRASDPRWRRLLRANNSSN